MKKITVSMARARLAYLAGDGTAATADAATSYYGASVAGAEAAAWCGVGAPSAWREDRDKIAEIAALTGAAAEENDAIAIAEFRDRVEKFHAERVGRLRAELQEWAGRATDAGKAYAAAEDAFNAATQHLAPAAREALAARWAVKRGAYRETMGWLMRGPELPAVPPEVAALVESIEDSGKDFDRRFAFAAWSDALALVARIRGLIDEYEAR